MNLGGPSKYLSQTNKNELLPDIDFVRNALWERYFYMGKCWCLSNDYRICNVND